MARNIIRSKEYDFKKHPQVEGVSLKPLYSSEETNGLFNNLMAKLEPGSSGLPAHVHENSVECFYVVQGKGEFLINGEWNPVQEGGFCMAPKGTEHQLRNNSDKPLTIFTTLSPPMS